MGPSDADGSSAGPPVFPYGSAAAFRTALRDRFAAIAKADTRYSLDELQRQFAYDRALVRLFTAPLDTDGSSLMGPGHPLQSGLTDGVAKAGVGLTLVGAASLASVDGELV